MEHIIIIIVSFGASVMGSICGIGGGVIIKPVLDATGIVPLNTINFLSGCTVLSMSVISVFKNLKRSQNDLVPRDFCQPVFDKRIATVLAVGGSIGGLIGKNLYQNVLSRTTNQNEVGVVQAAFLLAITIGTLLYTLKKNRIKTLQIQSNLACVVIGILLGMISSFLGIGGGPINQVVLFFFFSMGIKQAAAYSLYVIMFSQTASLISSIVNKNVPKFSLIMLVFMVCCGVAGGMVGAKVNKKIKEQTVNKMFIGLMVVIILINIYNIFKYM